MVIARLAAAPNIIGPIQSFCIKFAPSPAGPSGKRTEFQFKANFRAFSRHLPQPCRAASANKAQFLSYSKQMPLCRFMVGKQDIGDAGVSSSGP
jgi:hypothetical protein